MSLSGKVFGNIIGYKKIFLGSVYIHKKHFSLPHDTFHVVYIPNFRPAEITVGVSSSGQRLFSPKSALCLSYLPETEPFFLSLASETTK